MGIEKEFSSTIKSKDRVRDRGEVFTSSKTVHDMINMDNLKQEIARIDSNVLEPSCGNGNFLVGLVDAKMDTVDSMGGDEDTYNLHTLIGMSSLYGVDIMSDNVAEARERMFDAVNSRYIKHLGKEIKDTSNGNKMVKSLKFIFEQNIIYGDMLESQMGEIQVGKTGRIKVIDRIEEPLKFRDYNFDTSGNVTVSDCLATDLNHECNKLGPVHYYDISKLDKITGHDTED